MLDPMAYVEAQRLTRDLVEGALPDRPIRAETVKTDPADRRLDVLRRRLSATLRQVADLLEPAPECPLPATQHR